MEFVNALDKAISEFEEYKTLEKSLDKKIIYSAIVSRLLNLRTTYFKDWEDRIKEQEMKVEERSSSQD